MMNNSQNRKSSRFFTGDERELNEVRKKQSFQRFFKRAKSKKRAARIFYAVLFAVTIIAFIIICLNLFFNIDTVELVGSSRYSIDDIISHTDIVEGMSLFSVSDSDFDEAVRRLSYIKEISITRSLPNTLIINVTADSPEYVAKLYGEYFILSKDLRVLERVFDMESLAGQDLIELALPEIDSALVGQAVAFSTDVSRRYVSAYLDALEASPIYAKTTAFDLRDRFNLAMIASDIYLVNLGNGDELGTKLTAVAGMLGHAVFADGVPATIDATDPSQCPVIKDPDLVIEFDE